MSSIEWWKNEDTLQAIRDYACMSGLLVKSSPSATDDNVSNVALTIRPSSFPAELFSLVTDLQPALNVLIDTVSTDHAFLEETLGRVLQTDDFTKHLYDIYCEVRLDNKQTCALGLNRVDYMVDYNPVSQTSFSGLSLKQIEMNTIASSFFGLTSQLKGFHNFVCTRYPTREQETLQIPDNPCLTAITDAVAVAWKEYRNDTAYVLMVVNPNETNVFDQRPLEFGLWQRHSIRTIRKTLTEVAKEGSLGPDKELIVAGVHIAVVYYRSGYSPLNYPSEKEWQARLLMEKSRATNCPSAAYQLVGTKKMQQKLAEPGALERFVSDEDVVQRIRSTFAGLYSLDMTPEGDRAVEMALREPHKFVMKPQREGGGNNFYGDGLRTRLEEIGRSTEREAYILMDRVCPPPQMGFILRSHMFKLEPIEIVSELGIFGAFVRKGDQVILNNSAGHILRTKPSSQDEGGVAVGVASLDSPSLLPADEFIRRVAAKN